MNRFRRKLNELNEEAHQCVNNHLKAAVENVVACARYERIENGGPKYPVVSEKYPLIHR